MFVNLLNKKAARQKKRMCQQLTSGTERSDFLGVTEQRKKFFLDPLNASLLELQPPEDSSD
jgi:hypothetical protein